MQSTFGTCSAPFTAYLKTGQVQNSLASSWTGTTKISTSTFQCPNTLATRSANFNYAKPKRPQDSPHPWFIPTHGARTQYAETEDTSPVLPPKKINRIQQVIGTFLYYAIIVDVTMLTTLGTLSSQQSKATEKTYTNVRWFLNYAATHPNAKIRYHASDMVLRTHSNASYLSAPQAIFRAGGNKFLSTLLEPPPLTGPIHTVCKIMSNVMGSAAEAEIGATYINGQELIPIRT